MNIAIIYHSADWDGKLSNEVCRFHLAKQYPTATIHSYGWDYGQPIPKAILLGRAGIDADPIQPWSAYDQIYMVDLCIDQLIEEEAIRQKLIWIDHHASAIEKWDSKPSKAYGYRLDGVAACRLCWQWFAFDDGPHGDPRNHPCDWSLPIKADYVHRSLVEPELIRLAGEHDVFDHRDERAVPLQFGLTTLGDKDLAVLVRNQFKDHPESTFDLAQVINTGRHIKTYIDKRNAEHALANAVTVPLGGRVFCCLNVGQRGNSQMFTAALKDEHHACLAWWHTGKQVSVSLYSIPGKSTDGILEIAQSFGGGGHKGACGFRVTMETMGKILDGLLAEDGRLE